MSAKGTERPSGRAVSTSASGRKPTRVIGPKPLSRSTGFGHRRIGLVNNGHDLMHGHILLACYRSALARHGIGFDESLVRTEEMTEAGGYRLAGTSPSSTA
jgi:hypothetical protein